MGDSVKTYNVNPGVRGISAVMKKLSDSLPHAVLEPWSQVTLQVTIPVSNEIELCEILDGLAVFYSEIKNG